MDVENKKKSLLYWNLIHKEHIELKDLETLT